MGWISYDLETRGVVPFRAGVSFRNRRSSHCATSASRVPVARASLWLDDDARARGSRPVRRRERCGVDTNECIAFVCVFFRVADVDASPGRRRRDPRDAIGIGHRSYQGCISLETVGKKPACRVACLGDFLCERVRDFRKTDDESFVCVRDVLG